MANINHVKSYFWYKLPILLIYLPFYLLTTVIYLFSIKKHKNQTKFFSPQERTEKIYSWLKGQTFFKNIDYVFVNQKHLLQAQTLYIVNKDIGFNDFFIFPKIFKDLNTYNYSFFCQKKKFWHRLLSFTDFFYSKPLLSPFIKNKFSIVCCWKDKEDPFINDVLSTNYLSIVPVVIKKQSSFLNKKIFVVFGKPIKPHNFLDKDKQVILNQISSSF